MSNLEGGEAIMSFEDDDNWFRLAPTVNQNDVDNWFRLAPTVNHNDVDKLIPPRPYREP